MTLLEVYARREREELRRQGVEVHVLGELDRVGERTRSAIESIVERTRGGGELRLNLLISYGGREEILRAAKQLAEQVRDGHLTPEQIDEDRFGDALLTRGLPNPDLLVRTSGEHRISNFMLWQLAYTELHVSPVLWPDFDRSDLFEAILDYQQRERRFGRVAAP
jgi:undecaprenyl diphosphate synthase